MTGFGGAVPGGSFGAGGLSTGFAGSMTDLASAGLWTGLGGGTGFAGVATGSVAVDLMVDLDGFATGFAGIGLVTGFAVLATGLVDLASAFAALGIAPVSVGLATVLVVPVSVSVRVGLATGFSGDGPVVVPGCVGLVVRADFPAVEFVGIPVCGLGAVGSPEGSPPQLSELPLSLVSPVVDVGSACLRAWTEGP